MAKSKSKKKIETRKNEVRFSTSDPKEMLNKYLAKRLLRTWSEDFVDENNGEIVSIERNEIIMESGVLIDANVLSQIQFFLTSGDIQSVEVSNQKREAFFVCHGDLVPWSVTAQIRGKKHRFLLYAESIHMALDIVKDYIELNFSGSFLLLQAKDFNRCIIIKNNLKKADNTDDTTVKESSEFDKKFYQVDTKITYDDTDFTYTFIVNTQDVDTAMIFINDWLTTSFKEKQKEEKSENTPIDFKTAIESAKVIPCSQTIEKEFSMAYLESNVSTQD